MYFVILRQINAKFTFCAYHRSKNKEILLIPKNIVQTICFVQQITSRKILKTVLTVWYFTYKW